MANYLDNLGSDEKKIMIYGLGIAVIGIIAVVLYRAASRAPALPASALSACPSVSYAPTIQYPPASYQQQPIQVPIQQPYQMAQHQLYAIPPLELQMLERRLDKLESKEIQTPIEQRLSSLEVKLDNFIKSTVPPATLTSNSKERNVVSMPKIKSMGGNYNLSPAEHHNIIKNSFDML